MTGRCEGWSSARQSPTATTPGSAISVPPKKPRTTGKDHFAADRESGDAIAERWPDIVVAVRENRRFLQRAVRYVVEQTGVRQFLDIGTGLPTANNTHEVAQAIDPACRIVYVDNDALVLAHARALLTSTQQGRCAYLDADVRQPEKILRNDDLHRNLDLHEPIALMLGSTEPDAGGTPQPVLISEWRRDPGQAPPGSAVSTWGGVGRKR